MKKPITKATPICLLLLFAYPVNEVLGQQQLGTKLAAMGINGTAIKGIWSIEGNIAGISNLKSTQLGIGYTKYPADVEWNDQSLVFALPLKHNYFGLNFQRSGINEYNIIKAGFAMAKKFGPELSIAIKANYHQLQINNYGTSTGFSVDVGAIYNLNELFTLGICVNNPSFQKFNNKSIQIEIPTSIYLGTTYQISDKVLIAATISKDFSGVLDGGFGIDYRLLEQLNFRGGLTLQPFKEYVGFGFNYKNVAVDFAVTSDPNLGFIPQIALAYAF